MPDPTNDFSMHLLDWVAFPAGQVARPDELAAVLVGPFSLARTPLTNAQFGTFIEAGGYKESRWWQDLALTVRSPRTSDWTEDEAPKLQISWFEAVAYCRWLSEQIDARVRLPTEWEWQWAAMGERDPSAASDFLLRDSHSNLKETSLGRTNLVSQYADHAQTSGLTDMFGNVWEWCLNEGKRPENDALQGTENRALRGGGWNTPAAKALQRSHRSPRTRSFNIGFRPLLEG